MSEYPAIKVLIDWDRAGREEDISQYVKSAQWRIGFREGYQDLADESTAAITLDNTSRLFSPDNAASVYMNRTSLLYRPVRIALHWRGEDTTMWRGWSYLWDVATGLYGAREVRLECVGAKRFYDEAKVSITLTEGATSGAIIEDLLALVAYPPGGTGLGAWSLGDEGFSNLDESTILTDLTELYDLDTGQQVLSFTGDTWGDTSVYKAIGDVCAAERGKFFFDRSGRGVFWDRQALQCKYDVSENFDPSEAFTAYGYEYGRWLWTRIRSTFKPRKDGASATAELWTLDHTIHLRPSDDPITFVANYRDTDSGVSISATDIVMPTQGNGYLVSTPGYPTQGLWEAGATSAQTTLQNYNPYDIYISAYTITGRTLTTHSEQEALAEDVDGALENGWRELQLPLDLIDDFEDAQYISDHELYTHKDAVGAMNWVRLQSDGGANTDHIVRLTVGDRIRIAEAQSGHSGEYFIVGENHNWADGGHYLSTEWFLEPASMDRVWELDTDGYAELDDAAWLGF